MSETPEQPLTDPTALVELFNLGRAETPLPWNSDDLAAMLRHQLRQPLGPSPAHQEDGYETRPHLDLLPQPHPPLERLRQVKDQAKSTPKPSDNEAAALPREVATVIYYAALAVADALSASRGEGVSGQPMTDARWVSGATDNSTIGDASSEPPSTSIPLRVANTASPDSVTASSKLREI